MVNFMGLAVITNTTVYKTTRLSQISQVSGMANCPMAESSRAPALWRHDCNVNDQNMVVLLVVGGRLAMLREENLPSEYNVNEIKSM